MSALAFLGFACGIAALLIVVAACVSGGRADDRLDEYAAERARNRDDGPWLSEPLAEVFPFHTSRPLAEAQQEAPGPLGTAAGRVTNEEQSHGRNEY